jgi:hypothetical protein
MLDISYFLQKISYIYALCDMIAVSVDEYFPYVSEEFSISMLRTGVIISSQISQMKTKRLEISSGSKLCKYF